MSDRNTAIVRRIFEEIFSQGKLEVADEVVAHNYVSHDPATPDFGQGPQALKQVVGMYRQAFPDLKFTVDQWVVEDNLVVARWTATGTHQGPLGPVPATGKQTTVTGQAIHRMENGKLAEHWGQWDQFGLLQQLGVVPALDQAAR